MTDIRYLPDWVTPVEKQQQQSGKLTRLAASRIPKPREVSTTVAGESALIPEAFGRCLITRPRVYSVGQLSNSVVLGLLWSYGEVSLLRNFYVGNEIFGGTVNHYSCAAGQIVDPLMASAIAGYTDDLPGIFHSVVVLTADTLQAARSFSVDFDGRKLYDPRTATVVATSNPALMYRYVATAAGLAVDDASIITAANYCDENVGGWTRWSCGLVFDRPDTIDNQLALIAEYAGCFHVRDFGTVKLVPDRPTIVSMSFSD